MSDKTKSNHFKSTSRTHRRPWKTPAIVVAGILVIAGILAWQQTDSQAEKNDPNVVVNLTSRVGKQAPSFTLMNSEGRAYTITPGDGRKYVLIFHMGSI